MIRIAEQFNRAIQLDALDALKTPCYVFSSSVVQENFARLKGSLNTRLVISLKANPNAAMLARCGPLFEDGVELASLGELKLAIGQTRVPFVINTPALTSEFVSAASSIDALIIFDSLDQIDRFLPDLGKAGARSRRKARVGLRVNAASLLGAGNGSDVADHFGMMPEDVREGFRVLAAQDVKVEMLHSFAGSCSFRTTLPDIAKGLSLLARDLRGEFQDGPMSLGLGGGFTSGDVQVPNLIESYRQLIEPIVQEFPVYHETGRAIFASAGIFVVRVMFVKEFSDALVAVCDGGMAQSFLLAQTESRLRLLQEPLVVARAGNARPSSKKICRLVGPSCNRQDCIGTLPAGRDMPMAGDFLIFSDVGAYNSTYTPSTFLQSQVAQEYLVP
jgi:diaminopimelate decarboxylase